jgi:hypothetical protein
MKALVIFATALAIASSCIAQKPDQHKFTVADVSGKWMGVHPEWTGVIVFYPNGNLVRPHICTGRWELMTEKDEAQLVIFWDGYPPSKSTMVSPDHFRQTVSRGAFDIYRVPPAPTPALPEKNATSSTIEAVKARLDNSAWRLAYTKNIRLNADGSVTCSWDQRPGTWALISTNALVFDVPWEPAPAKIVTTNLDATILRWTDDENILGTRQGK